MNIPGPGLKITRVIVAAQIDFFDMADIYWVSYLASPLLETSSANVMYAKEYGKVLHVQLSALSVSEGEQ